MKKNILIIGVILIVISLGLIGFTKFKQNEIKKSIQLNKEMQTALIEKEKEEDTTKLKELSEEIDKQQTEYNKRMSYCRSHDTSFEVYNKCMNQVHSDFSELNTLKAQKKELEDKTYEVNFVAEDYKQYDVLYYVGSALAVVSVLAILFALLNKKEK